MYRLKLYSIEMALVAILMAAVGYFGYLGYGLLTPQFVAEPFSGDVAMTYARRQMEFGPRITGTNRNVQMGEWLINELRAMSWDIVIQPFSATERIEARNIIAIRGTGEAGLPVGILTTPYDSRLTSDRDPLNENQSQPSMAANVSASGVAVLLELARTLDVSATGHTICLVFLDAESNGGLPGWEANAGGTYFAQRVNEDIQRCGNPRFVVSVQMIGGEEQELAAVPGGSEELRAAIWRVASDLGYGDWFGREAPPEGVAIVPPIDTPSLGISSTVYRYRLTLADTSDKLSEQSLERIGRALKIWLERGARF
jgi:glutaminyl-peptide cyclotransferase